MNQYKIDYSREDMSDNYIGSTLKWGRDDKDALMTILKKQPEKNGICVFKRGGTGKILSIKKQ